MMFSIQTSIGILRYCRCPLNRKFPLYMKHHNKSIGLRTPIPPRLRTSLYIMVVFSSLKRSDNSCTVCISYPFSRRCLAAGNRADIHITRLNRQIHYHNWTVIFFNFSLREKQMLFYNFEKGLCMILRDRKVYRNVSCPACSTRTVKQK